MSGSERRSQVLEIAAGEFANRDQEGLFLELVGAAFDRLSDSGRPGVDELNEPWANGRTRIQAGPFEHITADTNR